MQFIEEVKEFQRTYASPDRQIIIPDISEAALEYDSLNETDKIKAKNQFLKIYFFQIGEADRVLVWNQEKRSLQGYIGANTLMEITAAYIYGKPIYLLHEPEDEKNRLEILGLHPVILHGAATEAFSK